MSKRLFDLVIGGILALLALPVILLSALAVAVVLRTARPFFVQTRVGRNGKHFRLVKVRTLPLWAPRQADKYTIHTVPMPRVCRVLRSTHLDELPQLFQVLTGKMSLVGPRPEMPYLLATFEQSFVATRSLVRPGCTGLWQVSAAAEGLIGEAPEYDLYYVRYRRLRLDLWIIMRTVRSFLPGAPAAHLESVPHFSRFRHGMSRPLPGEPSANLPAVLSRVHPTQKGHSPRGCVQDGEEEPCSTAARSRILT